MQPAPLRLQQAIRIAFKAAKPSYRSIASQATFVSTSNPRPLLRQRTNLPPWQPSSLKIVRLYSDEKGSEVDRKVDDVRQRIDEALQSRAETARTEEELLKKDETIIHTNPEASSIVYNPDSPGESAAKATAAEPSQDVSSTSSPSSSTTKTASRPKPLPSQISSRYSNLQKQFSSFMDNLQGNIFIASKRLNDLTGYSGIEALKQEIEQQEHSVREARKLVRDNRSAYSAAIENRSATQREVNDLLHRKHAWSPSDLERFTNLYRSDHANEQAEQKAHEELSKAEQQYEEASTKLAKSILARYHEEQIWSDKIRQMSTWGTWGLMGLNVLLFIVFQIMIEPWRRRRLVRGFEEKVQQALKEKETLQEKDATIAALKAEKAVSARAQLSGTAVAAATADAEMTDVSIPVNTESLDAGAVVNVVEATSTQIDSERATIEQAAESITTAQILQEEGIAAQIDTPPTNIDINTNNKQTLDSHNTVPPLIEDPTPIPSLAETPWILLPDLALAHAKSLFHQYNARLKVLFDETVSIKVTQRDLTASALEGAFLGAVTVVCFFWAVGVGGPRGRW